ncbi:MAG: recombinase family protein [Lachnospiraceae bacterium]|nr:recombinase family protein [Lachnospiraceae bacterium]
MSRKNQSKSGNQKIAALYCRLSLEDGRENESMSISNQKLLLKDYAEKNGMFQYEYYVDDGYTGRNFNRPSFQRMIADIEAGKVGCVITKDLSRLGRNYIEAGSYIEIYFPKHNVRYIAVTDGVDSLTRQEMDITPFKNILNDMYSRDISKKVLAGITARSRQGKFCGGTTPYGLMRDPDDKGHLIINPEEAPVIRKIYDMALDGMGCMRISKRLMEEKIPITRLRTSTERNENYYYWSVSRISHILRNPFYKGAHLVFRSHQKGIRSNTVNLIPREEWEVIENCHEAIIQPDEWQRVQEMIDAKPLIMVGNACPYDNIFHGIIYCATCGKSMQVRYEKVGRTDINRTTKQKREAIDKTYFICQTYNRLGRNACPSHKIEARDLHEIVLKDIQELAALALKDADAFYKRLTRRMEQRYMADKSEVQKECDRLLARNQEIDDIILNLYTDKTKGVLSEQRFLKLTGAMEAEQESNKNRLHDLGEIIRNSDEQECDVKAFIEEIRQYATITELDEAVLHRLINRILIGEVKKVDGQKIQEVKIIYNFVGEIPAETEVQGQTNQENA